VTAAHHVRCLALCLTTLVSTVACDRQPRQDRARSEGAGCEQASARALTTDSVSETGLSAFGDLDCDGSRDTVLLEKPGSTGAQRVVIRGSITNSSLPVLGDVDLRIAGFADFNLDHVRDILLAHVDESVVSGGIVLVARDRLKFAAVARTEGMNQLQYIWDPTAGHSVCLTELLPRVVTVAGRPAASFAYGYAAQVADCMRPTRQAWWVERDTLAKAR